jgi:hypothetical protein
MKGQAKPSKYTGEERVRESGSLFKKLSEITKRPSIINAEVIKSANKSVADEAKTEFKVALTQIFGIELKAGKAVSLDHKEEPPQKPKEKQALTAEHLDYFSEFKREAEGQKKDGTSMVISQQLESILAELRNLKNSSDELENVFKDVVVDEVPEKPGVYHLTFYEGFLKLVMKMRDKVEDGVVYAKLFRSRKAERSYSSMAKKGGTSYTMHHDRAVATQTG